MNCMFTKTASIAFIAIAMTSCASSQKAADMQAKISPASESETASNPNLGDREVQNQQNQAVPSQPNQAFSNQPNQAFSNQPNQALPNQQNQAFSNQPNQAFSNQPNQALPNQQNQVNVNPNQIASEQPVDNTIAQTQISNTQNSAIQEGQFVHNGFNNQIKVELVKVKRIQNPESKQTENTVTVAVKLRVKRLVKKADGLILFRDAKARNVDTYEEYEAIKYTDYTGIENIPSNAWAEAYFWLEVPQGIEALDIVFPQTEVFKNVPIES
jgi:hypothetical protein